MRIKFKQNNQREFLIEVLKNLGCPSLKELINRGINVNYSTLKNYFSEARLLPEDLYVELCKISNINQNMYNIESIVENWGQIKGGKKGKRRKKFK